MIGTGVAVTLSGIAGGIGSAPAARPEARLILSRVFEAGAAVDIQPLIPPADQVKSNNHVFAMSFSGFDPSVDGTILDIGGPSRTCVVYVLVGVLWIRCGNGTGTDPTASSGCAYVALDPAPVGNFRLVWEMNVAEGTIRAWVDGVEHLGGGSFSIGWGGTNPGGVLNTVWDTTSESAPAAVFTGYAGAGDLFSYEGQLVEDGSLVPRGVATANWGSPANFDADGWWLAGAAESINCDSSSAANSGDPDGLKRLPAGKYTVCVDLRDEDPEGAGDSRMVCNFVSFGEGSSILYRYGVGFSGITGGVVAYGVIPSETDPLLKTLWYHYEAEGDGVNADSRVIMYLGIENGYQSTSYRNPGIFKGWLSQDELRVSAGI